MTDLPIDASPPATANVVLQPAGADARRNLERSVLSPVDRQEWSPCLTAADVAVLDQEHPTGRVPMWGTTAGVRGQMRRRWDRMQHGDLVLFLKQNQAYLAATVTHKWESAELADRLWTPKLTDSGPLSWQLMFSFTKPRPVAISYTEMAAQTDTERGLATRSFNVYGSPISDRVASLLDVDERALLRPLTDTSVPDLVRTFDAVDAGGTTKRRLEQPYLRDILMPGSTDRCALCSRQMDVELLVAAHIKKRALCTFEEKTDLPAVAMPACRFGCDELFERGFVWVDSNGRIRPSRLLRDETAREYWQQHLRGGIVWDWKARQASHKYFEAHRQHYGHV